MYLGVVVSLPNDLTLFKEPVVDDFSIKLKLLKIFKIYLS